MRWRIVVNSPPGRTRASRSTRSRGSLTSTGSAPTSRMAATCSRTAPCSASTPIRGRRSAVIGRSVVPLPAADGEPLLRRDLAQRLATHRLAQAGADLGQDLRVVVVRGGLDDRRGVALRVLALEDAAADEDGLGAELAHEARIGRRGNASCAEVRDRQRTELGGLLDGVERGPELLGGGEELVIAHVLE